MLPSGGNEDNRLYSEDLHSDNDAAEILQVMERCCRPPK